MSHITCCYIFQKRKSFRGMSADSADSMQIPQGMGGECKVLYIAYLVPKTNRLFADRYQLDSHWDQLLSLFGQAPLITPRVTQLWKYLQRQQKRISIRMDLVYLWWTSLYRSRQDWFLAMKTWIHTPNLEDEQNSQMNTQVLVYPAFTKTESPGSGGSSPMSISWTPSPVSPDQCITINAEISSRSLPISLNLPGLNAYPLEGTWTNSPLI